jgi:sugar phosphate isomerase/epimerase
MQLEVNSIILSLGEISSEGFVILFNIKALIMPFPSLPKSYKRAFPFKLATTSYIYPDRIIPNVTLLAPFFDEIELVLFESEAQDNLPGESEINALKGLSLHQDVGFNIHLPIDIFLGDRSEEVRSKAPSIVKRMIERTLPLDPYAYILHFDLRNKNGEEETDLEAWHRRLIQSIKEILEYGIEPKRISIETLGYPFEWIEDIIREFGLSICLDIGHILIHGRDLRLYLERYLPRASIIHLHGFQNGIDHLGIDRLPEPFLKLILSFLRDYKGTVSIEVFSIEDLKRSLILLEEKWQRR